MALDIQTPDTISDQGPIANATPVTMDKAVDLPETLDALKVSEPSKSDHPVVDSSPDKSKKKKKKSKSQATGFEEYYADAPMTPVEAKEEKEYLYNPETPLIQRVCTAISKFLKKRRLSQKHINYFNDYLAAGGIDNSQNNFMGNGFGSTAERKTGGFIPSLYGNKSRWWAPNDPGWEVDFTGVVAGWLTNNVPQFAGSHDSPAIRDCITVVTSFLRYLLVHDVCNEYKQDILNAIDLCSRAETELPQSMECATKFPGVWNILARAISTARETGEAARDTVIDVAAAVHEINMCLEESLPDDFDPMAFLNFGFFLLGKKSASTSTKLKATKNSVYNLQVCQIEKVPLRMLHEKLGETYQVYPELCRVKFKHFLNETDVDIGDYKRSLGVPNKREVLLLDADICSLLKPDMKVVALICELNNGAKFVHYVENVYPEFYSFLFQNMMRQYQPHEESTKPPPSALTWSDEEGGAPASG